MDNRNSIINLAKAIANSYIRKYGANPHAWNWHGAILIFALMELYKETNGLIYYID